MFSLITDANMINIEFASKWSSSRAISKYLSYINTKHKKRSALSALGNNTAGVSLCAGLASERRRYK